MTFGGTRFYLTILLPALSLTLPAPAAAFCNREAACLRRIREHAGMTPPTVVDRLPWRRDSRQ